MTKKTPILLVSALMLSTLGSSLVNADQWHFNLGLSYFSGFDDLVDLYESNLRAAGFVTIDTTEIPIGITLRPYYQRDDGLRYDIGIGPMMILTGDTDHFQLPLNGTIGYTFKPKAPTTAYVRGGLSYHIASGDYDDGANVGFLGAAGIEFLRDKTWALGIEAAYDSAEVDIINYAMGSRYDGIKTAEFMLSFFLRR